MSAQVSTHARPPKVSVVIPVMNERRTLAGVIRQARRVHPDTEVIVVINGSSDGSGNLAKKMGARVITYDSALGHDVGRGIGAAAAQGEIILFTDGDIVIPTNRLKTFIHAIDSGVVDIALNKYIGPVRRPNVHNTILAKYAMNALLCHPLLKGVSLTAIPHAMSRKAVDRIGPENLAVPPKAQAIAIYQGLVIKPVQYVEVGLSNPRKRKRFPVDPLANLIVGDHLEAIDWYIAHTSPRGICSDFGRLREMVRD